MKKIILVAGISICILFTGCKTTQISQQNTLPPNTGPKVVTQAPKTTANQPYSITTATFAQDSINIEYPQIKGFGDDSKEKTINDLIKNNVLSSQVEEPSKSFKNDPNNKVKLIVNLKYRVKMCTNELLSVVYTGYAYYSDSAHQYKDIHTVTIDLKNVTKLELADFTAIDSELVQKIKQSTAVTNDDVKNGKKDKSVLINQIQKLDDKIIIYGFKKKGANYSFYVTPNSLGVSIPIAPSAIGDYALVEISGQYKIKTNNKSENSKQEANYQQNESLTYKSKLGFSIDFPESWKGKYIINERDKGITVLQKYSNKTAMLFEISTRIESEWNEWAKTPEKEAELPVKKIAVSKGLVFVYHENEQPPYMKMDDEEKRATEEYNKMVEDIKGIIDSFKITE